MNCRNPELRNSVCALRMEEGTPKDPRKFQELAERVMQLAF
jgi:hypothetical protein